MSVSCDLDLQPENALTYSNSFNTENELNATTTSIHYLMNTNIPDNFIFMEAGTFYDENNGGYQYKNWNPNTVAQGGLGWKGFYDIIFESNLLLDNIHKTKDLTKKRLNFHKGQAHFALGLSYLILVQRYGDCVITENSEVVKEYEVSPMIEVLDKAIQYAKSGYDELPIASELEDLKGGMITNKQYASKGTCAALLAHLYAWKGGVIDLYGTEGDANEAYKKSIEYATKLIDGKVGNYSLCSSVDQLCNYLSNPKSYNPETIFSITYDSGRYVGAVTPNRVATNYVSWPVNKTVNMAEILYWPTTYRIYKNTIENLYPDTEDERRQAFFYEFDKEHNVGGKDYAIMYKYREGIHVSDQYSPSGLSFSSLNANLTYWRLADIILLRAECYAKIGDESKAIADLNTIRNRAKATPYPAPNDTEGVRKAIFREREREFIGENDARYFDIVRNNYISTELEGNFKLLTKQDILDGALVLPIPKDGYKDTDGRVVNRKIRQKKYWIPYL
ncbi:MAG: RagB/SusD family nutrient uptake outer membrane protein [Flavobacteriaceae bacterium]|nr:RagB/SusD family nutrient uptake outer membrane protein [Flavobacteriaceae bacterium]